MISTHPFVDYPCRLAAVKSRVLGKWGALVLLVVAPGMVLGDGSNEAHRWLDRMAQARQALSYDGTFVYHRGQELVAMKVTHVVDSEGERERLVSLNGPMRQVIRDNHEVTCILPGRKPLIIGKRGMGEPFPAQALKDIDELARYYRFTMAGGERMVGRMTKTVAILPRDQYRYAYRLWIDEATGLLLKSELVNEDGDVVEQLMFTSFNVVDQVTPAMRQAVSYNAEELPAPGADRDIHPIRSPTGWLVGEVPAGFLLAEHFHYRGPGRRVPIEHMIFTDGLASVSVFIEGQAQGDSKPFMGFSRMGAVNAYGATMGDHQVIVVGEVPPAAVKLISQSIRYQSLH